MDQIQADLDAFMDKYNRERTNQGRNCKGRTPEETFLEGIALYQNLVHKGGQMH